MIDFQRFRYFTNMFHYVFFIHSLTGQTDARAGFYVFVYISYCSVKEGQ